MVMTVGILMSGCKDPDEIGQDILPDSDGLYTGFTDTVTVLSRTVREDSLRSDELSLQLIGNYVDPYFGKSYAECYSQVVLAGTPSFSTLATADSLILKLFYKGFYGDTNAYQTINVFRLTESMNGDSVYYSNRSFTAESAPIGSLTFQPRPNTRVVIDSDTVAPQLRIPMSMVLADSLIALNGSATFQSNEAWKEYFKGIKIMVDSVSTSGTGCISYFDVFNAKLTLYYHDTSNIAKTYNWALTGAKSSGFTHNYNGFPVEQHLLDTAYSASGTVCLQAMAGVKTKFTLPYLDHLKDSGEIVVNRALLKITLQDNSTSTFPAPSTLLVVAIDSTGSSTYFPADYFEPSGFFGGGLSGTTYTFNLARQVNRILSGAVSNNGFYLVVSGSSVQATRALLGTPAVAAYPIKLDLYYTRLP
ncbi:MAG: hypothetical protein RL213_515 [Bacteroidota bacterium]|jgi:WD40 repeat protein